MSPDEPGAATGIPVERWLRMVDDSRELGVWPHAEPDDESLRLDRLVRYGDLLLDWNRRFNLTAITDPDEVLSKHFLDSLTCALAVDFTTRRKLADVGTGAGFPGLVLKIAYPHLEVVLIDAVRKRLGFLDRVIEDLGLTGVRTLHARAEDAGALRPTAPVELPCRERFDVVVARAVAPMNVLVEWLLPLARVGGCVLAMKGPEIDAEVSEARDAIHLLGGEAVHIVRLELPGTGVGRSVVSVAKTRATPARFPRGPGSARKQPLGVSHR